MNKKAFSFNIFLKIFSSLFILLGLPIGVFLATHPTILEQHAAQQTLLTTKGVQLIPPNAVFAKSGIWGSGIYKIGGVTTDQTILLPQHTTRSPSTHSSYEITRIAPLPQVQDQGALGSCVAWTTDYYMRGWYAIRDGYYSGTEGFAPMYTFSQIEAPYGRFVGSSMPENLYILWKQGVDTVSDYLHFKMDPNMDWQHTPNQNEMKNAANYKITGYKALFAGGPFTDPIHQKDAINALEDAISHGNPVGITLVVNDNFKKASAHNPIIDVEATDPPVDPGPGDPNEHVVTLWGYSDTHDGDGNYTKDSGFWMINSWGLRWGLNGKALLSMDFIKYRVKNAYIITGVQRPLPTPIPAPTCERGSFCSQSGICNAHNGLTKASGSCFTAGLVCCKKLSTPTPIPTKSSCTRSGGTCTTLRTCRSNCDLSHANACMKMDCQSGQVCCY